MLLVLLCLCVAGSHCLSLNPIEDERLLRGLLEQENRGNLKSSVNRERSNRHNELKSMDLKDLYNLRERMRSAKNNNMGLAYEQRTGSEQRVASDVSQMLRGLELRDPNVRREVMKLFLSTQLVTKLSDDMILSIAISLGIVPDGGSETPSAPGGGEQESEEYDMFKDESSARRFLQMYDQQGSQLQHEHAVASFIYNSNMTDENAKKSEQAAEKDAKFSLKATEIAKKYYANRDEFEDALLVRQLAFIRSSTMLADGEKRKRLQVVLSELKGKYSSSKYCLDQKCYSVEPDTEEIFKTSRDSKELLWAWEESRRILGYPLKDLFFEAVELKNEGARDNGYTDLSEVWMNEDEIENIEEVCEDIFQGFKPLYVELHAYVRRKLQDFYKDQGPDIGDNDAIPAHLLGNIWAQQWHNIIDIVKPFPEVPLIDATKQLKEQKYTPLKMFKEAERFYKSLGLPAMTKSFWNLSIIEQNKDVNMSCHGSAQDFSNGKDYAIQMCTSIDQYDFYVVHHEMGHIQYYMAYKDQPLPFRGGANSGFHEAIGDAVALSVMSETHLRSLNLIEDDPNRLNAVEQDEELSYAEKQNINMLMRMALEKIPVIPWAYIVDKWRWAVLRGDVTAENSNEYWWKLRAEYSGLKAPLPRNADGFDLGSKFHVPNFVPYIRYFIAHLISFTFHESMCDWAGHRDAVNYCDIFGSKEAGAKLEKMMSYGQSLHWEKAMKVLVGDRKFGADAITNYFRPLTTWLKKQNEGHPVGWDVEDAMKLIKSN